MRLRLLIKRHELPDTALLWAVDEVQNPTISQVLDQINEVIPLESGAEWGLEEYVLELKTGSGSFECLHYMPVRSVLKEEDEVVVRPLSIRERKQRRDAGRDQITQNGRHIIDGVAFGGTKRKALTDRPPVVIPSRKRARILDVVPEVEEDDTERPTKALRITQYSHSDEDITSPHKTAAQEDSSQSDSDGEDSVSVMQNDDDDFPIDSSQIDDEELDALMKEAESDKEDGTVLVPVLLDEEIDTYGHPEIPLEELHAAFPEYPTKVLQHFLSVPNPKIGVIYNALAVGAVAKKPKTAVIRAIKTRIAALNMTGRKSEAQKETKHHKPAKTLEIVEPVVPDTAGDDDDNEDEENDDEEENPDDNGGVFTHGAIDAFGKLKNAETKHVKFEVSDDEDDNEFDLDTSDSESSSSSSDSDSDDESEVVSTKKAAPAVEDSDTSSSGSSASESGSDSNSSSNDSSDSSSNSDSSSDSDSDSEPEQVSSKVVPKATPLNAQSPLPPPQKGNDKPVLATVPPGEGRKSTKARNQRRRASNVLQRLQKKGILPAGVTLTEFTKLDGIDDNTTPEEGAATVAALRAAKESGDGAEGKRAAKEAKLAALKAELQAARERMLAQLQGGGIDVSGGGDAAEAAVSQAAPAQEKRKNKAGAAANRHIFGALGLKVPKNQEEKDAISKDLMKGVRAVKTAEPAADIEIGEAELGATKDSWKKNISVYRAVETHPHHLDEVYADPEFPFRQKSYISEDSLLHPSKRLGKGKRKKNRQQEHFSEGRPASKKGKASEEAEQEHDEDEEPNDQLMRDAQEAEGAEEEQEDLISLPDDPSTLPAVEPASLQPGTIIAFQELSIGENWQPVVKWNTACVLKVVAESSEVDIVLALRDREVKEYNEETGERVYGKFDMPQDEDEEDVDDDGVRTKPFAELTELRIVQAAPEDLEDEVAAVFGPEDMEVKDDNNKVTTDPITSTTNEATIALLEEEPQPEANYPKDNESVADKDSQQQLKDKAAGQEKENANQMPDLLASLDATLNASTKETTVTETTTEVTMTDSPEVKTAAQDSVSEETSAADGVQPEAVDVVHALATAGPSQEANDHGLIEEQVVARDRACVEKKADQAIKTADAIVTLPESGNHSPKFHGLASFSSTTTIAPSFNLSQTSQVEDVAPIVSVSTSSSVEKDVDHGRHRPVGPTSGHSSINAKFSQSILSQSILADSVGANMDDDNEEPTPEHGSSFERQTQLDGTDDREKISPNNFPGTQFSEAMGIPSSSLSPSPFLSIKPIATSTSAQPSRQATSKTVSSELPSPSQAFSATKKLSGRVKETRSEEADAAGDERARSSKDNVSKHLPPPVNPYASLKDRLASKKGTAPKTKILAKRTFTRTKNMGDLLPARISTSEPREPSLAPKADIGVDREGLFASQSQSQPRRSKKRQSMPAQHVEQSSPFRVPSGSQQVDLTLSDDEDLRGEVMHIPDAEEVDQPDEFVDKSKRRLVNRNERVSAHKRRAETYNRRQTRG